MYRSDETITEYYDIVFKTFNKFEIF
jgi:hypothetical protein